MKAIKKEKKEVTTVVSVRITREQAKKVKKLNINLSATIRKLIDELENK